MALKVEFHKTRNTLYDLSVQSIISNLRHSADDLDSAFNAFNYDLKRIARASTAKAEDSYKILRVYEPKYVLQIWHINSTGDLDRHLATVTFENK